MKWGVGWGQRPEFRGQKAEAIPNPDYWRGERPPVWGGGELGVERPRQRPLPLAEGYLPALPLQPGRLERARPGTPVLHPLHPLALALGLAQGQDPAHFPPLPSTGSVLPLSRVRGPGPRLSVSRCKGRVPLLRGKGLASCSFFPPELPVSVAAPCNSHPSIFISLAPCQPSISFSGIQTSLPDMESNLSGLVPAAGLVPALPPAVTLGLTAAYTTLYALLFFSVYAQLWLVLLYGHKRLSYQTVFLALCLLWAALRTTLFSFYFRDTPRANRLGPLPFWLLYCCPVCLQFFTLTLMNLYFAQVVFKAKAKRRPEMSRGLLAVRGAFVGASLLFLLVNVLCAVLSRRRRAQPWALLLVRVLVSDSLFVICALSLAACLCLVARRAPSTSIYLEAKGTSVCQAAAMGGAMVLLYASRACYNLAALALAPRSRLDAFDYDWYNVSDQADLVNDLGNKGYLVFGLILFVWELLPTTLLVGFFRVHRPPQDLSTSRILNGQVFGSRSYFFDRAGHCEDEGCSWEHGRSESTSMSGSLGSGSWYGAIGREPGWCGHHHSLYSTPQT
nr:PREDICTED: integral membrane protein GPR137 isoform X3 [Odobenus rosmarus divergens]